MGGQSYKSYGFYESVLRIKGRGLVFKALSENKVYLDSPGDIY